MTSLPAKAKLFTGFFFFFFFFVPFGESPGESLRRRRLSSAKAEELGEAERAIKACGAQLTLRRRSSAERAFYTSSSRPPEARNLTDIG
jgi:hypothetical protein